MALVNFPAPTLTAKIDEQGTLFERIKISLVAFSHASSFLPLAKDPLRKFREEAAYLLPKSERTTLINLCQSASAPRVSFDTIEREAA